MAYVPAQSSRSDCRHGLLYRPDAHLWCAVLLFRHRHDRRRILRCGVMRNPTTLWIAQQMREAWPYVPAHRFLLFDRDAKFGSDVVSFAKEMGSQPIRTAFRSPWQNGVAERWVGSCRRDLLDHVIVLNERHLKRLLAEYVRYYHEDRTHLGLAKTRQQVGRLYGVMPQAARFALSRDLVDSTTVTRLSPRTLQVWSTFV